MRALAPALPLLAALAVAASARADYVDPWGLPSGSASLRLATQDSIQSGGRVQAIDFATGAVDSLASYLALVLGGVADLLFVELVPGESAHWLRAPEDPVYQNDQPLLVDLGVLPLAAVADMLDDAGDPLPLASFAAAAAGHAYALLQVQRGAEPETTAVKLAITALGDSLVAFDWAWQPNGSREFIPTPAATTSLGALKARY
ncbi:hypothetical protein FJ251_08190 [bacterium]|nr:hypothetical protein [bacterium]